MAVVYGFAAVMLVWAVIQGTLRGRVLFTETAEGFLADDRSLPQPMRQQNEDAKGERSLASYLIFPRPEDWVKWVITPGVFVVAAWSTGNFNRWPTFLALWLIMEYLIYSARYQWNDVRGVIEDQAEGNRRLPAGPEKKYLRRNVGVSLRIGMLRLAIAIVLGIILKLTAPILLLIILIFAIAVAYEALRSPKPISITLEPDVLKKLSVRAVAIWCVVGLGYGIRSGVGFLIGGIAATNWEFTIGVDLFIAFGIMFVAMTWVLAATDYCMIGSDDKWRWKPGAEVKPHIASLLRYVPKIKQDLNADSEELKQGRSQTGGSDTPGRSDPILVKYNSFLTPWNLAFIASIILGSLEGLELAHANPRLALDMMVLPVSLLGACLMIVSTSSKARISDDAPANPNRTTRLPLVICATDALLIVCVAIPFSPFPKALIAVVPWLAVTLVYLIFCYSSYEDIKHFAQQIQVALESLKKVKLLPLRLVYFIIGKKTWDAIISLSKQTELAKAATRALATGNGPAPNGQVQHTDSASKPAQHSDPHRQP